MIRKPSISVIMSCYDEPLEYVDLAIRSIVNQTFENFEFIIILDNPNNPKIEQKILSYKQKDKRIVFIKNKKNVGLAKSLNEGIKVANGKYIARMDADDISKRERLEKQLQFMKENRSVDLVFSKARYIDEQGKFVREFSPNRYKVQKIKQFFFREFLLVHPTLFCKSFVLKNNLYDYRQKKSQDFELWIRLITKGYQFDLIDEFLISRRILNKNSIKKRVEKIEKSNFWTLKALNKNLKNTIHIKGFSVFYLKTIAIRVSFVLFKKAIIIILKVKENV